MTELDLLNLARSATENEISLFAQVITINFAMVVGIYYFLHGARMAMKVFAFAVYLIGMLLFLGQMLMETSLKIEVLNAMRALPHPSVVTQDYVGLSGTWLAHATSLLFNGAFWLLCIGIGYLTFFWDKDGESP
ncbi:MAG: hypothetical protein JSR55_12560 [Proteobacteria bacterium]|nr:hypothetical protein [Pseudomonadota bacterium]